MSDQSGRPDGRSLRPEPLSPDEERTLEPLPELRSWRKLSVSRRRLHGETLALREELRATLAGHLTPAWWQPVVDLMNVAGEHAAMGSISPGFEALNAARRIALEALSSNELKAEAKALRAEADDEKLEGWRSEAIQSLLKPFEDTSAIDDDLALFERGAVHSRWGWTEHASQVRLGSSPLLVAPLGHPRRHSRSHSPQLGMAPRPGIFWSRSFKWWTCGRRMDGLDLRVSVGCHWSISQRWAESDEAANRRSRSGDPCPNDPGSLSPCLRRRRGRRVLRDTLGRSSCRTLCNQWHGAQCRLPRWVF